MPTGIGIVGPDHIFSGTWKEGTKKLWSLLGNEHVWEKYKNTTEVYTLKVDKITMANRGNMLLVTKYEVSAVSKFHEQWILILSQIKQNSTEKGLKNNANENLINFIKKSRRIDPWSAQWSKRRSRTVGGGFDLAPKCPY